METLASILVVDDEENVRDCIIQFLQRAGYQVFGASNGIEALDVLASYPVDLILADIAMPKMNGYQLYQRVSGNLEWVTIPFIFLTARTLDSDIRYGKELGVDDYLTKPFERDDLLAAVRGRLRRARQLADAHNHLPPTPPTEPNVLSLGKLRIDLDQYRVWHDGKSVKLSAREFRLLAYLARQKSRVVPLKELIQITHELDVDSSEAGALLRPLIRSLRRKLGYAAGQMGCIANVHGVGYQLVHPSQAQGRQ